MKLRALLLLSAIPLFAPVASAAPPKAKDSVALARTWDEAVAEAKDLNVPIVVHSHGFYCPPCWGMHSGVMCNKKYMDFAEENTVEVMCLSALEEGVQKKDKKAETYEAKVNGEKVEYLCEFPGRTVEELIAIRSTKAGTYNDTGKTPFTALVDPWTEQPIEKWSGSTAGKTIIEAVTAARKTLEKDHGKGASRKDVKALDAAIAEANEKSAAGDFAAGGDRLAKLASKSEKWAESLQKRYAEAKAAVVAAAEKSLAALEEKKETDAVAVKREVTALLPRLRGTGLEQRAKDLLASLQG